MAKQVTNWRKSTASATGEQCVEVGSTAGTIAIRDTHDRGGHALQVPAATWARFTASLR
jgi:hypothetical protein